jgi:hypothetical protein
MDFAEMEEYERFEEMIRQSRDSFDSLNKKQIQKALNVLGMSFGGISEVTFPGSDPFSEKKLKRTLGEEVPQVMNRGRIGGQSRRMYILFVVMAILLCILVAVYQFNMYRM